MSHTAVQYPADVYRMYEGAERLGVNPQRAASEEGFVQVLRVVFASPEVGRIVQLLRQEAAAAPQQ